MRKILFLICSAGLLASCSTPKYTYHFDHYDYNSGRKHDVNDKVLSEQVGVVTAEEMVAEGGPATPVAAPQEVQPVAMEAAKAQLEKKYKEMSKSEKKAFRKEAKGKIKTYIKAKKSGDNVAADQALQAMDQDLKLAAIFGAVGLVFLLFGGVSEVFTILGVIGFVIGVIFFVKWLVRQ